VAAGAVGLSLPSEIKAAGTSVNDETGLTEKEKGVPNQGFVLLIMTVRLNLGQHGFQFDRMGLKSFS
jgi:hypothetical protein